MQFPLHMRSQEIGSQFIHLMFQECDNRKSIEHPQSEIIADVLHNYSRISEIMHGYHRKFGDNNSRRS